LLPYIKKVEEINLQSFRRYWGRLPVRWQYKSTTTYDGCDLQCTVAKCALSCCIIDTAPSSTSERYF